MDFSAALQHLKLGERITRKGWNGKGIYLFLVDGSTFTVNRQPLLKHLGYGAIVDYRSHIDMLTADGTIVPWVASQTDLLASDWDIVW